MASTWHEHRAGTIRASRHTTAHKRHYVAQGCSGCGHAHRARSPPPNATPAKASVHASLSLSARVRRSGAGGAPSYDRRAPAEGWSSLLSRLPRRRRTGPGATAPQGTGPGATAPQRRQRGRRQRWCASGAASRGVRLARAVLRPGGVNNVRHAVGSFLPQPDHCLIEHHAPIDYIFQ